jgi:hypothetical protein
MLPDGLQRWRCHDNIANPVGKEYCDFHSGYGVYWGGLFYSNLKRC